MKKIIENKIRCDKCGDVIESKHKHDAVWCSCHSVGVDGGHYYLKRMFKDNESAESYTELSVEEDIE